MQCPGVARCAACTGQLLGLQGTGIVPDHTGPMGTAIYSAKITVTEPDYRTSKWKWRHVMRIIPYTVWYTVTLGTRKYPSRVRNRVTTGVVTSVVQCQCSASVVPVGDNSQHQAAHRLVVSDYHYLYHQIPNSLNFQGCEVIFICTRFHISQKLKFLLNKIIMILKSGISIRCEQHIS